MTFRPVKKKTIDRSEYTDQSTVLSTYDRSDSTGGDSTELGQGILESRKSID